MPHAASSTFSSLARDQRGATSVEYALVLVAILLVVTGAFRMLGAKVDCVTTSAGTTLTGTAASGSCAGATAVAAAGAAVGGGAGAGGGLGASVGGAGVGAGSFAAFAASSGGGGGVAMGNLGTAGSAPSRFLASARGGAGSYGADVAGTEPKPLDATLADLSANVYNGNGTTDGFTRVSDGQLAAVGITPSSLVDASTGFKSAIYTDGKGNYVVAFAGTNDAKDVTADFKQALGFKDGQYNEAVALAKKAKAAYGDNVIFTGHSLGGSLASTAAIATNSTAVTFNGVGVSDTTIKGLGLDPTAARQQAAAGQIRSYRVEGEIVSATEKNASFLSQEAIGHDIALKDPKPLSWGQRLIPGAAVYHAIQLHRVPTVIAAIHKDPPGTTGAVASR